MEQVNDRSKDSVCPIPAHWYWIERSRESLCPGLLPPPMYFLLISKSCAADQSLEALLGPEELLPAMSTDGPGMTG